jgi:MFS family permease
MLDGYMKEPSIVNKDFLVVFILLFNAYEWLYMTHTMIGNVLSDLNVTDAQNFSIWTTYYVMIIGSGIVGSILSNKIRRLTFLYFWMILGVVTSLLPLLLGNLTLIHALSLSILLGISFGLGIPSCLAYFADHTLVGNRGRIAGIILLVTNLSAPLFILFLGTLNLAVISIIFAMWRASGLLIFFLKPEEKIASKI